MLTQDSDVELVGFTIDECIVNIPESAAKYLRVVHRIALELSVQNRFGPDIGGYWLMPAEIKQLRTLPSYYPASESSLVQSAIDAYIKAQLDWWSGT